MRIDQKLPHTREDDDTPELKERIRAVRREGRRRTLVIAIAASCVSTLGITRAVEVQTYSDNRQDNIVNCRNFQDVTTILYDTSKEAGMDNPSPDVRERQNKAAAKYKKAIEKACEDIFRPKKFISMPFVD